MERAAAEFCCILETVPGVDGTETVKLKTVNSKLYFTNPVSIEKFHSLQKCNFMKVIKASVIA